MGNTEDKTKKIPRNPNIPVKDEEVDALLKKAAEQVSDKEVKRENIDLKKKDDHSSAKKPADDKKLKENAGKSEDSKKAEDVKVDSSKVTVASKDKKKDTSSSAKASAVEEKDFKVEDEVYVTKQPVKRNVPVKSYKMTVGDVIGAVLEGIWAGIKLLVVVTIITAIAGFFLSRDLMIRGRSGEQISKTNMNVAANTLSTRLEERKAGKTWNETIKKEKLTLEADDGRILVAQKIVVNKKSNNWVVILHGQNGSVEDIYDIGQAYALEGYNIMMPDLRAHGESEGSYYGMGWLDRLDVINWIDVILDDHPSANVIIHGVDLGADTALMLSGEPLKDSIKVIIAEGAYTNAWEVVKKEYQARHVDWPVFPILHMINPVMKVWAGYDLKDADAVKQVAKTKVPILLIHGKNDSYVTEDMTKELDEAIASDHEVLTIATGTHEDCRFAEPDTYYNKVFEFVEKYVK